MTSKSLIIIAALGSVALLGGAFAFQHFGGLPPCKMCLWQRWPHAAAILIGVLAVITGKRELVWVGTIAALTTASIGFYHAGVEQLWWEGPSTCTSGSISGLTTDELLDKIMNAPVTRCDEISWSFMGFSMAAWNAVLSLLLAIVWLTSLRQK